MTMAQLPILSPEAGLSRYLQDIRKFPILGAEEEFMLAKRLQQHGDMAAAQQLVTSHLRLVAKIAMGYRGYGLPVGELISEGNIGLMQSVKKFDPDKGFRLSTYAMWWIRAAIQEYVLRSWSLVKIGTSAVQKKLFFNLRKLKQRIGAYQEGDLTPEQTQEIADELDVSTDEVTAMNRRLSRSDQSLNAPVRKDGEGGEWIDMLSTPEASQETLLLEAQEGHRRSKQLAAAMATLNERERDIFTRRRLSEPVETLETLSQKYDISRERVRQIDAKAFEKVQAAMRAAVLETQDA